MLCCNSRLSRLWSNSPLDCLQGLDCAAPGVRHSKSNLVFIWYFSFWRMLAIWLRICWYFQDSLSRRELLLDCPKRMDWESRTGLFFFAELSPGGSLSDLRRLCFFLSLRKKLTPTHVPAGLTRCEETLARNESPALRLTLLETRDCLPRTFASNK